MNNNASAFLELVRAGLWEKEARLSSLEDADWKEVYQLASEQSVPSNKSEKDVNTNRKTPKNLVI